MMSEELKREEILGVGPDDGDWADVISRASRARRRYQVRAAVLLTALVVVGVASAYALGGIPWSNRKPNLAPTHPPLASPCSAGDIRGSASLQGATQSLVGVIELMNVGRRACSLLGRPRLSVLGSDGKKERVEIRYTRRQALYDPLLDPRGSLRALEPGKHVSIEVQWINECRAGTLALTLAGGSRVRIPSNDVPPCLSKDFPTSLSVQPFFTPDSPAKGASMRLPLSVRIVGRRNAVVGRGIPALRARRGSVFHFKVALKNTSERPFRFRSCPLYEEQGPSTTRAPGLTSYAYVLNCHAVGVLAPKATVLFEMQMPIPRDALLGGTLFSWFLAPYSPNSPSATVELRIVP